MISFMEAMAQITCMEVMAQITFLVRMVTITYGVEMVKISFIFLILTVLISSGILRKTSTESIYLMDLTNYL